MYKYVQLDSNNIVTGISYLSDNVEYPHMILLEEEVEIQLGSTYNLQTGEFIAPVISVPTPIDTQPTLEEMQAQTLLNTELLLIYKELETGV